MTPGRYCSPWDTNQVVSVLFWLKITPG